MLMMPYWIEALMRRFGYERVEVGLRWSEGDAYASDRSGGEYGYYTRRYGWRKIPASPTCRVCGWVLPHPKAGCWR